MTNKAKLPFDPKVFLAKADGGRTISQYRKNQIIFSQGDSADSVFYIIDGRVKFSVISEHGKEAVVALLGGGRILRRRLPGRPAAAHGDSHGNDRLRDHAN